MLLDELWIRLSLLFAGSRWRDPSLYGHELDSDDFWILAGRWDTYCKKIAPARIHPRLGWSQGPITAENPLGLVPWTTDRLVRDGRKKILFYGDSYVEGQTREECWIPALLESHLQDVDVLHLGVGGYGTDQMHLLCQETVPLVDRPHLILFGVEPFSFDRAGRRVRSYQKPLMRVRQDGSLEVTNLPIETDPERYYREARLGFRSFARAARRVRRHPSAESDFGFDDKVAVNRAIIDANQLLARGVGAHLMYVLFCDQPQLERPDQRRAFFLDELTARSIDVFDTRPVLLAHTRAGGTDGSELYSNGHLNDLGNQLVAAALVTEIERHVPDIDAPASRSAQ